MNEKLKPCPFCGGAPKTIERPDNIDGTQFFYAIACYCYGCSACAHKMAVRPTAEDAKQAATDAWNRRAQPAQTGAEPVAWMYFDSDGDSIFGHPNGYRPDDAVPVYTHPPARVPLTDDEIDAVIEAAHRSLRQYKFAVRGQQITQFDGIEAHVIRETERAHGIGGSK